MELQPAYITVVEGPPPEFQEAMNRWSIGVFEGQTECEIALVEMRTYDGAKLVQRCQNAWSDGRDALFNFPLGDGTRGELDIIAARWEKIVEGNKLYLWLRITDDFEIDENLLNLN